MSVHAKDGQVEIARDRIAFGLLATGYVQVDGAVMIEVQPPVPRLASLTIAVAIRCELIEAAGGDGP